LARRASIPTRSNEAQRPPAWLLNDAERLHEWIERAAESLGVQAKPVSTTYSEALGFIEACGPALIRLDFNGETRFLAVIRGGRGSVQVLTTELAILRVRSDAVRSALCHLLEAPLLPEVDRLLNQADVYGYYRPKAVASVLNERLGVVAIQDCWILCIPAGASLRSQLSEARLFQRLTVFLAAHTVDSLLIIAAWWMIGQAVLQGRLDYGLFAAWVLLVMTRVPIRMLATWMRGRLAIDAGSILKRHLLAGSLRLQPDEVREQGVGQLLGRVIESEALESLALSGGLSGLTSIIELIIAAVILGAGAENLWLAALLVLWSALAGLLARRHLRQRQGWTETRLGITNDLIERMTGHRTRLAQEARERWHDAEDDTLDRYLDDCRKMDRSLVVLMSVVPRGWMILSLVCLVRTFLSGESASTSLAIAFGGILFARGALKKLTDSLVYLGVAAIAWRKLKPLFEAATRPDVIGSPDVSLGESKSRDYETVVEAHDVVFRHPRRAENVLDGCTVRIAGKDRILLEGASGCGKSTFMSILTGIREPQSGLVMVRGLDRQTVGSRAWRRTVAAAPQFHENHVLTGTMAFNLLMGRRWPPRQEDFEDAEKICREVGLGDLLDRMPSGLLQQIGETGWQLSHGERSRLFLARALLQRADMVILDECFGALDPDSLKQAMHCAQRRSKALMVIAHA